MKCELCGQPTPELTFPRAQAAVNAMRCFRCYSLEEAIHADPEIAQGILETMKCETEPVLIRTLVWRGKHGAQAFMARTDTELKQAYLKLFQIFQDEGFYDCDLDGSQMIYYDSATEGVAAAAKWLIELRSDLGYEYEDVRVEHAEVPQ
jgi:hypothetical protein